MLLPSLVCSLQGVFTTTTVAAAAALLAPGSPVQHMLSMFFKEDLLATTNRRLSKASGGQSLKTEQLKQLVVTNTRKVRRGGGADRMRGGEMGCMLDGQERIKYSYLPTPFSS